MHPGVGVMLGYLGGNEETVKAIQSSLNKTIEKVELVEESLMISTRSDKAPKHVKAYYKHFGYDESDTILCECCSAPAVDLHHVEPRSSFGSKRKGDQDHHSNLIALCRHHHDLAHGSDSRYWKEVFKLIIEKR